MPAGTYNIICDQGATFDRSLFYGDDDGNPNDLSAHTAKMEVRNVAGAILCTLTTADDSIVLGSDGSITLALAAPVTAALPLGRHVHHLVVTLGAIVDLVVRGTFYVREGVTP